MVVRARLDHGRYQGFAQIAAKVDATLADERVDGSLSVDAPFAAMAARFKLPVDPLAPGAAVDLRLDVTRLDIGETMRAAAMPSGSDGHLTLALRLTGTASSPSVDLTATGRDLQAPRPAKVTKAVGPIDIGRIRAHLTYAERAARADIDFASSHGGTLRVDAGARVDLSYPRVTRGLVVEKIPVHGKVVAKDLEVGWLSQFNDRIESLGGQVTADAKIAGTIGDPQFLGDVRWKNGAVVTTVPPRAMSAPRR